MMSDKPSPEEVRASIIPKSDQLNADDLVTGPITVTIAKVRKGDREQPIHIDLVDYEGKSYRPCKTMRRVLIAVFSDDPKCWIGQRMTLYCDPNVTWAGVKVGGIRISHLSGLEHPRTFMLTQTRGKKTEVTVKPLEMVSADDQEFIQQAMAEIKTAESMEVLRGYGDILKDKSNVVQDVLRPLYGKRLEELKEAKTTSVEEL